MQKGRVEKLLRYPVKSLLGEILDAVELDQRGIIGDRLYAISNEQGKFGSGKSTRRFRRIDGLFKMSAQLKGDTLSILFPCGETLDSGHKNIDQKLSIELGQAVSLTKENQVPHFDDGAIHVVTSADLELLRTQLPDSQIDMRRFRANILIDSGSLSSELLGKSLRIGSTEIEIIKKTERCRMVCLEQGELNYDPDILGVVAKQYQLKFGVYASVVRSGLINIGDNVTVI
jgi:uncharacterized protein YcbX